jgi:ParB family chromosome partitioning protein
MNYNNMAKLPEGKTRLDLVREGLAGDTGLKKRGRLIVSISKIKEDLKNERKTFRNMDGLTASIRAVGLIEPITVTAETNDTYRIITGHRRYRAAKAAGLEQVEILIREPEDEIVRRQKSVISNVQREDVGPVELAEALQAIMDEHPGIKSQEDLARLIGKNKGWVSGMLRILTLSPRLQGKVATSQLSVSYDSMITIARVENEKQQESLTEAVLAGATVRDIREQINSSKGKGGGSTPGATPKPKRVYHTSHKATVIVQGTTRSLTTDQVEAALKEALRQLANK